MGKNILSITILLFLASSFISCNKEEKDLLVNTKWRLVGFVEVEIGNMKESEPTSTECESCYTITFKKYQKWEGITSTNELEGKYKINYNTNKINIFMRSGTAVDEFPDGKIYIKSLEEVDFFSIQENELKLYYNNKQNYLLFKSMSS